MPFLGSRVRLLLALAALGVAGSVGGCAGAPAAPAASPRGQGMAAADTAPQRLQVLFVGDGGHHQPAQRLRDVAPAMLNRGIALYYTEDLADINLENLRGYDAILLYANYEGDMPAAQEEALLAYVTEGGGFVPVHSASGNFRTSTRYVALLGGQFASHGVGTFRTRIAEPTHDVMQGFGGFESWDETYVHRNHNPVDRTVLEYRENEPWTWVRTHGKGRVFYTAWGHDQRTWRNPGFHDLLERGIRWASGENVQRALAARTVETPFEFAVVDVPFPPPHYARLEYEATKGPMDRRSNYPLFYDMQLPMTPEQSMRRMVLPAGFRVELFAAEPDVVKPIAMNWDERGRLWVAETVEYPYPREVWPDGGGKDRIKILEDTDGDGRADKTTVFAGDMNIPTGFTFARGGVVVVQAPQTLFLQDTDGDDRADVRQVLFEGWSQRDTHAGPSNLQYGLDNWIWGVLGYSGFTGTVGGETHKFSQGVYRFRQDGSKLEFLRRTNNNTWGLGFDEEGGAFISTANGNPSTYLQFPRKNYALLPDLQDAVTESLAPPRMIPMSNGFRQVDWVGAYTAGADHPVYTARSYPKEYWNRVAFVAEPTGHVVGTFILDRAGSTYDARHPSNLVTSDDQWFSPVAAEVGPDGSLWIADWYNYVNQHNAESDRQRPSPGNAYANPLRDRQHGRIYRIVHEDAAPPQPMTLAGASPQRLVETLRHPNMFWRTHAQRLLVERGEADVAPALIRLAQDPSMDEAGINAGVIHALWTLHGLSQLDGRNPEALAAARAALQHPSAGVRRNAIRVLPRGPETVDAVVALLRDPDAQVRLEALVALGDLPESDAAGRAIYALLAEPAGVQDQWIREAATLAAAVHTGGFLAAANASGVLAAATGPRPDPENLMSNASFEQLASGAPAGWSPHTVTGSAELTLARGQGRNGGNALRIASTSGADASWVGPALQLEPNSRYQIGAWVRTRGVGRGAGRGAEISVSGLPPTVTRTNAVAETTDWTFQERVFTAPIGVKGELRLSLGAGGNSTGEVWIDDIVFRQVGPEPGRTLESIVSLVAKRAPQLASEMLGQAPTPGPVQSRSPMDAVVLAVGVIPEVLQFDKTELRVKAGQQVRVVFTNTDNMEHNLVIIMPGSLSRVGSLADRLAASPQGRAQNYVPDTPDVVTHTPLLEPSARFELTFVAPTAPGQYEFVCTVPGHWRVMRGVFIVEPAEAE